MLALLALASCITSLYSVIRWLGTVLGLCCRWLWLREAVAGLGLLLLLPPALPILLPLGGALLLLLMGSAPLLPLLWMEPGLPPAATAAAAAEEVRCALFLRRLAADTAAQWVAASKALKPCSCTFSPADGPGRAAGQTSSSHQAAANCLLAAGQHAFKSQCSLKLQSPNSNL